MPDARSAAGIDRGVALVPWRKKKKQVHEDEVLGAWLKSAMDLWMSWTEGSLGTVEHEGIEVPISPYMAGLARAAELKRELAAPRASGRTHDAVGATRELFEAGVIIALGTIKNYYGLGFNEFEAAYRALTEIYLEVLEPRAVEIDKGARPVRPLKMKPAMKPDTQSETIGKAIEQGLEPAIEYLNSLI